MTDLPLWLERTRRRILHAYATSDITMLYQTAATLSWVRGTDWTRGYAHGLDVLARDLASQLESERTSWTPVLQASLFLPRAFP